MKTNDRNKQVEYYLTLRYPITLQELALEDGGGYAAMIPQLGKDTFVAIGETPQEALLALDELREHLITRLVNKGVPLPEPNEDVEDYDQYSGVVYSRVPRMLHARLSREAEHSRCSINKLVTQFIAEGLQRKSITTQVEAMIGNVVADEVAKALATLCATPTMSDAEFIAESDEADCAEGKQPYALAA